MLPSEVTLKYQLSRVITLYIIYVSEVVDIKSTNNPNPTVLSLSILFSNSTLDYKLYHRDKKSGGS